jgi:hypothetical protein
VVGVDADGAVVALDDVAGDREAEAATAAGGARVVETREAFEDPLVLVGWDARTVVGDAEDRRVVALRQGEGDPCAGVTGGVVDEVSYGPGELIGVAVDLGGGDGRAVDVDTTAGPNARGIAHHDVVEVDGLAADGESTGVAASQVEEVFHEALEGGDLVKDASVGGARSAVPGWARSTSSSTSGCEASDFAGFQVGKVALTQRGTCTFRQKADNAAAAGASAVVIFNEGQPGRQDLFGGTRGSAGVTIPVVSASLTPATRCTPCCRAARSRRA